ncbi:hypothetical protein CBR_g24037 [Chara braunii]|uniref:RNA-directed DNA polymerase n=1 Tax=Chara braunii TaxID=69332 RepID=A0A388L5L7_CHABU|nr:hypothetical protein CBR_g24037 [Chara braunii]|eukprot:GBG77590.1 hypothetical protein CBR_g24037 [Chara braunii]
MYDKFGYYIDPEIPGESRKEALRRVEAGEPPAPPAMFRIWQEEVDHPDVRVEEIGENKEVEQERKTGTVKEEPIVVESDEEIERGYWNDARRTMERIEDVVAKIGTYQDKLTNMCEEVKEWKALRLRDELKARLSRKMVASVRLGAIIPKEAEWAETDTKMDWKSVACGCLDVVVKGKTCTAMVDTGAEMNLMKEKYALCSRMEIDCSDNGVIMGANSRSVFIGTASRVVLEIDKVKVRSCFFVMPDLDNPILLGRSFLSRTETVILNKHDGMMFLVLCDPVCGNYEVITCRNTGPRSIRNRPNPGSFTIEESEEERKRLGGDEFEEERNPEALTFSLASIGDAMDIVSAYGMADPEAVEALREKVMEQMGEGEVELEQEVYYERERELIQQMRENAENGPCHINQETEEALIIGEPDFLTAHERQLMVETMRGRHTAYAFNDDERGRLDVDKIPMIQIHTVPHEPWNLRGARYPNPADEEKVVNYLDGKIRTHVSDYSSGPYASLWFCFVKPNGMLRWVQDLQRLNAVTARDAGGLPNADALSEACAGRSIISLIDLYFGYVQFPVYPSDRPMTAMHTPRGLIHMNVALQGWTNAVAMVQRHMVRTMQPVSPHITQPYIDDLVVKGPKEKDEQEVMPGIRRFVWDHVQDLCKVLDLLKEHNLTASGTKSRHCMRGATILGFVCDERGRRPDTKKTNKILEWPTPFETITEVRSFLGTCGFWRVFIKGFAAKTEQLRKLVRQGPTALGEVLIQRDLNGEERPLRFESRMLNTTERNYSQFKRETLAVLHCLRIFRNYLFGSKFMLRMDPTALAGSLKNFAPSDPTIARWLGYIWMFDFELERIPGNKNRADGLSRVDWDKSNKGVIEDTPPVDGFLDKEEDVKLHINSWSLAIGNYVTPGRPIWLAPPGHVRRPDIVLKPCVEEDSWGMPGVEWMMELALADKYQLQEDVVTLETVPQQVEKHERLVGGMYLLANSLLQEEVARIEGERQDREGNVIHEGEDDDFEEGLTPFGAAMPRGRGRAGPVGTPLGATRQTVQMRARREDRPPIFQGGNTELFLIEFERHAREFGWDTLRMLREVRGAGQWAEPIANYVRESLTWQDFERRMEGLHLSPLGRDGQPIRFDGTNLGDFLRAFDEFADGLNESPSQRMGGFLLFVRRHLRSFVRSIVEHATSWGHCKKLLWNYYTPARLAEERRSMEKKRKEPEVTERRTFEQGMTSGTQRDGQRREHKSHRQERGEEQHAERVQRREEQHADWTQQTERQTAERIRGGGAPGGPDAPPQPAQDCPMSSVEPELPHEPQGLEQSKDQAAKEKEHDREERAGTKREIRVQIRLKNLAELHERVEQEDQPVVLEDRKGNGSCARDDETPLFTEAWDNFDKLLEAAGRSREQHQEVGLKLVSTDLLNLKGLMKEGFAAAKASDEKMEKRLTRVARASHKQRLDWQKEIDDLKKEGERQDKEMEAMKAVMEKAWVGNEAVRQVNQTSIRSMTP